MNGAKRSNFLSPLYLSDICGHGKLGRQFCAALCTTAGQHLAAVGRGHSLSKAMNLCSVTLLGLIGTNSCHIRYTSCKIMLNSFPILETAAFHNGYTHIVLRYYTV